MEDSVAVNIAAAKGLLWYAIKGNGSFHCIHKWACPHITFAHKGIAERKENLIVPVLGFICLTDLKWKGKFTF